MTAFDGNAYRKKVLVRLVADFSLANPQTGDPFFVFDLDPGSDQATVVGRIGDVVAFWQKERNSVKYKGITAELMAGRGGYEAELVDPRRRAEAARRVLVQRAALEAERFADLDRLADRLTGRFGGIPAEKVDQLRMLAQRGGMADDGFSGWLAGQSVLVPSGIEATAWEGAIRRQIRAQLAELARQGNDPSRYATLWTWLDLSPQCSPAELEARRRELLAGNQRARHDSVKTRSGELLAHVALRLQAEGGREKYAASLRADAADVIYQDVAEKALVTGEVTAADYETLVQRVIALGWGIPNEDARAAVRAAATALGASLAVAPAVDYIICGRCRAPQAAPPAGPPAIGPDPIGPDAAGPDAAGSDAAGSDAACCRYCAEPLYLTCPSCARLVEAAAVTCPSCGVSFRAHREAAARPEWESLERDVAGGRLWSGYDQAVNLERKAGDVIGPAGIGISQRRAELGRMKAAILAELGAALARPGTAAEAALVQLLARAADAPEVIAALTAIPIAAPTGLTARETDLGVQLSWRAAAVPAPTSYRVIRIATPPGLPSSTTTVGTTSETNLEDAGVPGGASLVYQVVAVSGPRVSAAVVSAPILVFSDLSELRAEVSDQGVELRWVAHPGAGTVVIERNSMLALPAPEGQPEAVELLVEEGPKRRIRPDTADRYLDVDARPGPTYIYRVFIEYQDPTGAPAPTPGRSVTVRVPPQPVAVTDLGARTERERTVISFAGPPEGLVQIYAGSGVMGVKGETRAPLAEPGTRLDAPALAALATRARLVGQGRRRVVDPSAFGRIRYTPITVVGDQAIVGEALIHLAVGRVTNLVATDRGDRVLLTFDLPRGTTEAMIRWWSDIPPSGPNDPAVITAKMTDAPLALGRGIEIPAPDDGRALYAAVYPAVRIDPAKVLTPGPHPTTVQVRSGHPVEIQYRTTRIGLIRRSVRVEIDAGAEILPPVVLVSRPGTVAPMTVTDGAVLGSAGGDGRRSVTLDFPLDRFPHGFSTVRLLLRDQPGRPTELQHPDPAELLITR